MPNVSRVEPSHWCAVAARIACPGPVTWSGLVRRQPSFFMFLSHRPGRAEM